MKRRGGASPWMLVVLALLAGFQASAADELSFGIRARPAPTRMADVFAPAVVRESPENEAAIIRLPDDSLRIYYIARPDGKELRSLGSDDGGLTWYDDRLEFALPGAAYHAIEVLVDRRGELQATFHIFRGQGRSPGVDRNLDLWHARTTGKRTKWEPPQQIFEGYVGSIRSLIQLRSGRILQPFARAVPERNAAPPEGQPDFGWHNIVVYYSDDDGATWQRSPQELKIELCGPNVTRYGAIEPNVMELQDGRIWMLIRDRCGRLYQSFSKDGIDWSQPKKSAFISSDSPAWTLRLKDGRLVIFWNACQRWDNPRSYAMGGREVLHAAISSDDGKSWRGFREVLTEPAEPATRGDRGSAYPTATQNAEGKIALISGQGVGRKSIVLFDPAWLAETAASDDFSQGLVQWTAYGASGVGLVEAPSKPSAKALKIRRDSQTNPAGAGWNFPAAQAGQLTMRFRTTGGFSGWNLALTDHFSVVADTKAAENAVYSVSIDVDGRIGKSRVIEPDTKHELTFRWHADGAHAQVTLDGKAVATMPRQRETLSGISYLRLQALASEPEVGAVIIDSVEMTAAAPKTGDRRDAADAARLSLQKIAGPETGGAVLDTGASGAFDADWATCPSVIHDGKQYRMYYSACYDANMPRGGIGLATSADGRHWQRSADDQPILEPGHREGWDGGQVLGPEIHYDGKLFRLWYTGMPTKRHSSGIGYYQIGLATSEDGIHFQRENGGLPVLACGPSGAADEVQVATPSIVRENGRFRMWYAAWSPSHGHTICTATSSDGISWQRENEGRPIAGLKPPGAYGHAVCRTGDGWLLLYMAVSAAPGLYAARSADGLNWTPLNEGKPVLTPGDAGSFDDQHVGHPFLLEREDRIQLWYTGYSAARGSTLNWKLRIGFAQAAP